MPVHVQTAQDLWSQQSLPRPRDYLSRRYPQALAAIIYRDARRQTDVDSAAGRVYLADLAEALLIPPTLLRELDADPA